MRLLTTSVARIIFGIPFLIFGIFHFMKASQMGEMVAIPPGQFWVYLTGLGHILAAIAFFINKKVKLAALLLALMLLAFILGVHLPMMIGAEGGDQFQQQLQAILKNIALIGGALTVAGINLLEEELQGKEGSEE